MGELYDTKNSKMTENWVDLPTMFDMIKVVK